MTQALRRLALAIVAAGALLPAATARATSVPPMPPQGLGVTLLEGPSNRLDDPRAHSYIVDHLAPGTTISRKIGFSNGDPEPVEVVFYAASADIAGGTFRVAPDRAQNELASWVTFSADRATLQPGETVPITVTITVPANASPGERYAAALGATLPSNGLDGQLATVSRVGIRIYLSVGTGREPTTAFAIDETAAGRNDAGHPVVTASVHNTGERAVDLSGSLQLTNGPASLAAGPFDVMTSATLAPGAAGHVQIVLDDGLPLGPWDATITLTSGTTTVKARARLTFPSFVGTADASPVTIIEGADATHASRRSPALGVAAAVSLAVVPALAAVRRRRRRANEVSM
jgi:hypothetical protein